MVEDKGPAPPTTPEGAKDALLKQVTQIVTNEVPDIADNVKTLLEKDFKGKLDSYIESLKRSGKSTAADVLTAGNEILSKMKKELSEMVKDITDSKMTATEAANKAINDLVDAMKLDPKFKDVLLNLGTIKEELVNGIKEANKIVEDIAAKSKDLKKNKHEIVVDSVKLMVALLGEAITVLVLVVYIMQLLP